MSRLRKFFWRVGRVILNPPGLDGWVGARRRVRDNAPYLFRVPGFSSTLILSLLGFALFAGCTVKEADQRTTIRFAVWATPAQQKVEQAIIDAFEKRHPDIRVQLLALEYVSYDEKIQAMMVGRDPPDAMLVKNTTYDDWAVRGVLADVTAQAEKLDAEDEFMPMARKIFARAGHYHALPVNTHGLVTFVNLDALAAAGVQLPDGDLTWDFILKIAPQLSRRAGYPAAPTDYALFEPPAYSILAELGGALFDDPFRPTRVTIDSPEGRAWIAWFQHLQASGFVAPRGVSLDAGFYQLFRDGRVAFFFSGRWQVPDFAGKTAFRWDVRPFPSGPQGRVTMHGGTGIAVASASLHAEAARSFAEFYAGAEGARVSMHAGRTVPVQRGLAHSAEFLGLRPPDSPQHFVDTMEKDAAGYWLYAPGALEVHKIVMRRMDEALADPTLDPAIITGRLRTDLTLWLSRQQRSGRIPAP